MSKMTPTPESKHQKMWQLRGPKAGELGPDGCWIFPEPWLPRTSVHFCPWQFASSLVSVTSQQLTTCVCVYFRLCTDMSVPFVAAGTGMLSQPDRQYAKSECFQQTRVKNKDEERQQTSADHQRRDPDSWRQYTEWPRTVFWFPCSQPWVHGLRWSFIMVFSTVTLLPLWV